jgi:hypothetical protein
VEDGSLNSELLQYFLAQQVPEQEIQWKSSGLAKGQDQNAQTALSSDQKAACGGKFGPKIGW